MVILQLTTGKLMRVYGNTHPTSAIQVPSVTKISPHEPRGGKTNMPEPSKREITDLRDTTDSSQNSFDRVQASPSAKVIAWKQVSEQKVDDVTDRASHLDEIGQRVSAACERVQAGITDAYERGRWKSAQVARQARTRARLIVDEYPLHLIAGVAGAAFLAGIFLRVWRSNRYE